MINYFKNIITAIEDNTVIYFFAAMIFIVVFFIIAEIICLKKFKD